MKRHLARTLAWIMGGSCGLALGATIVEFSPRLAHAQTRPAECYSISSMDIPAADPNITPRQEIWCYQEVDQPPGAKFIYTVDEKGRAVPELSVIVEPNGTITHNSLLGGEMTVHRVQSDYLPIPVPLEPPPDAQRVPQPISPTAVQSSNEVLNALSTASVEVLDIGVRLEGNFQSSVAKSTLPWRGYWFPRSSGRLHRGASSPMAKYDRFMQVRTGKILGGQSWEARHHGDVGTPWAGHCNGWAASSILRKEPTAPWTDPLSGVQFTVLDLKGLMMEKDYCPRTAFFGKRVTGRRPNENPRDILPALFHNTLRYYIGHLKKPVLADVDPGVPVENRVFSAYKMKIKATGTNSYRVDAAVLVHGYDTKYESLAGVAPAKEVTYSYTLKTDDQGHITGGSWISRNPDFLWVPLAPGECADKNTALSETRLNMLNAPLAIPW